VKESADGQMHAIEIAKVSTRLVRRKEANPSL
jgi:hypothetical protein